MNTINRSWGTASYSPGEHATSYRAFGCPDRSTAGLTRTATQPVFWKFIWYLKHLFSFWAGYFLFTRGYGACWMMAVLHCIFSTSHVVGFLYLWLITLWRTFGNAAPSCRWDRAHQHHYGKIILLVAGILVMRRPHLKSLPVQGIPCAGAVVLSIMLITQRTNKNRCNNAVSGQLSQNVHINVINASRLEVARDHGRERFLYTT